MRLKSIFFLLVFSSFLLTPVLVVMVDLDVDMTSYFSMNEEENTDGFKVGPKQKYASEKDLIPDFLNETELKKRVQSPYLKTWRPIYFETLSPPPERILS
ncbi:hypothetical protein [Marixanthomonas ophiurae]|uniref:Uncharacterized protein n=1 Tax=Marixanthomonas ophiurae TaxID=387659 RepID=A0A3E1QAZ1_9FLAO|nr:hypothetical protein [Marixanthomonas ophiurae]RFN59291.1 hypothetical protein DZ858_04275 [Marixanthomonas ophiurae]